MFIHRHKESSITNASESKFVPRGESTIVAGSTDEVEYGVGDCMFCKRDIEGLKEEFMAILSKDSEEPKFPSKSAINL